MQADIAIITIRDDEFGAVFDRLTQYPLKRLRGLSSKRTYAIFSVQTSTDNICTVALARCPEQGNGVSQQVAFDMMRDLDPQLLLVVGIAGGVPHNEFTLGDVVISSRIHNFTVSAINQSKITFDVTGGIHPLVSEIVASLPMYRSELAGWNEHDCIHMARPAMDLSWVADNVYGETEWRDDVLKSFNSHFGEAANHDRLPLFKTGSIASSNMLMKNTEIPTTWRESARSILAIEMEAAGALQAAQQMGKQYPVMAIRGISDIIGLKRDERWTSYACQSAGAFTCAFINAGIIEPRDSSAPTAHGSTQQQGANAPAATSAQGSNKSAPLDVFISYSAKDEKFKDELETHLAMLKRNEIICPHYSESTSQPVGAAGQEWKKEVGSLIERSQIILLLISPSFLASDYHYEEMQRAMKRHESGTARVIPIIIRSANISNTPFKDLLALPRNLQPIDTWNNRDAIWAKIAEEIQDVCKSLGGGK
ncbi:MAG: TIR domain-containing protein [Chloroflexi bacterium]|nr:MAG: TIR domain-containing protein [Chloroflexota bacterium]